MKNVKIKTEGRKLFIEIDLDKDFGLSKSGKTTIIASTGGNRPVDGETVPTFIGVNVYKK